MKLYIAGINHNDPMCRKQLIEWLRLIKAENIVSPSFVAPEWDEQIFKLVKSQRPNFLEMIMTEWDFLSLEEARDISFSLAYEGDAHEEIYETLPIVWLDHGREFDEAVLSKFSIYRMNYLKNLNVDKVGQTFVRNLSSKIRGGAINLAGDNPSINKERDRIFYEVIENLSENKEGTWGIVIVGSNHAADTPGSMRNLLDQRGHQCIVNLIDSI